MSIRIVQVMLKSAGFDPGPIDGVWGERTLRALQQALGLPDRPRITDDQLIADLKRDEGYAKALPDGRCQAYPDPLSGGDPWTIGYGHTGPEVKPGLIWTREQAEAALLEDAESHAREMEADAPWIARLDPVRRRVMHNMAFNLGPAWPSKWPNTIRVIRAGQWESAAKAMLSSLWAKQVGDRARRLAEQMRTGEA